MTTPRAPQAATSMLTFVALFSVVGCGGAYWAERWRPDVRAQHAARYGCDERDVELREVARGVFVAEGCNYRANYICTTRACVIDGGATSVWIGSDDGSSGTAASSP